MEALEARVRAGATPVDSRNTALWRFKIEQARLMLGDSTADAQWFRFPSPPDSRLPSTLDVIDQIEKKTGDAAYTPLDRTWERAYFADDGSPQPYWVFLPERYDPRRRYPLVVLLHGYDPDISKAMPWLPGAESMTAGTERGFIIAVPYGRRNTDFLGVGEDDVLAVREEMLRNYPIDAERVFLLGPSMGGYGVWAVGLKHPYLWAGLCAMAARSDTWHWLKLDPAAVAPWKLPLYQADDPRFLARNARNVPVFFQHGADDAIVPAEHSRLLYADWKKLGYAARYREIEGGDHYIYWQAQSYDYAFEWMRKLRRNPAPRRVTYATASLRNNGAYWARIEAFEDYGQPARFDTSVDGAQITVTSENVARLVIQLPNSLARKKMTLRVNGSEPETVDGSAAVVWSTPAYKALAVSPALKSAARSGTIRDAYRGPLLLVYGDNADKKAAQRFADEWRAYADGALPLKPAQAVTATDKAAFNLIIFGTRASNPLLAEIETKAGSPLPLEKTTTGYRIGTELKEVKDARSYGVIFCYPSPFDARREIVVHSGEPWGAALPVNHKFDLQPDYLVFTDDIEHQDRTNQALEAGYFDSAWRLMK